MEDKKNYAGYLKEKLKKYKREDVIISKEHGHIRAAFRQISHDEIKDNIVNPKRLALAIKQQAKYPNEEKFDCYFDYGEFKAHRYVIAINAKVVVVTVMKLDRRWRFKLKDYD